MVLWDIDAGWWFGTCFIFPYIGNNNPNWRTHIFQRGRYTTNNNGLDGYTKISDRKQGLHVSTSFSTKRLRQHPRQCLDITGRQGGVDGGRSTGQTQQWNLGLSENFGGTTPQKLLPIILKWLNVLFFNQSSDAHSQPRHGTMAHHRGCLNIAEGSTLD